MLVINVLSDQNVNIYHIASAVQEDKTETVIDNRAGLTVYFRSRAVLLLMSPLVFLSTDLSSAAHVVPSVRCSLKHFTMLLVFFFSKLPNCLQGRYFSHFTHKGTEALSLDTAQVHRASEWKSWHSHTGNLAPEFMGSMTIKWYFTRRRYHCANLKDDVMKSL